MPKLAPEAGGASLRKRLRGLAADAIPSSLLVKRGPASVGRRIALTFDDGPGPFTDAYLDVLERYDVRATFFLVGEACEAHRDALWRIVARGHEVASHGFSHSEFTKLEAAELYSELARTRALLPPPRTARPLVRPPRGALSLLSLARTAAAGYTTVLWSLDSDDCRTSSVDEIVACVAPARLHPGDIVLLHEDQAWTLEALPRIMEALIEADWHAVTVGELLGPGH